MKLTLKQQRFADEYIISGNAYESAIKAGYSHNYANSNVIKLLGNVRVKAYLDEKLAQLQSDKIATQEQILEYLTSVMNGEHKEEALIGVGKGAQNVIDLEVSAKDRIKAAELLGKRHRMWTDKVDLNASGDLNIIIGGWDDD